MKKPSTQPSQRDIRRSVNVGGQLGQVSTVAGWWRAGHFRTTQEARGAFELAYQQAMDGMGTSIAAWMGLSDDELRAWRDNGARPALPKKLRREEPINEIDAIAGHVFFLNRGYAEKTKALRQILNITRRLIGEPQLDDRAIPACSVCDAERLSGGSHVSR